MVEEHEIIWTVKATDDLQAISATIQGDFLATFVDILVENVIKLAEKYRL